MRKLILAVFALLAAGASHALGFGELKLDSALNQPLDASIELLAVQPSERSSVKVRLADPESYERFGASRSPALDNVRVEVVRVPNSDRLEVRLSTRQSVREPFLTFLLEADWPGGRALREYTVLLDPPVETPAARAPAPAETAAPTATAEPEETPRTAEPAPGRAEPTSPRRPTPARVSDTRRYGPIARNETLWSIARELRPDSRIGMNQMQLAIYRANPGAFNGNINRLLAGATLEIPDAEEVRAIDQAAARREVIEQQREYERYRRNVRNRAAPSPDDTPAANEVASAEGGELRLEPPSDSETAAADTSAAGTDADTEERVAENAAATAQTLAEAGRTAAEGGAETTEEAENEETPAAVGADTGGPEPGTSTPTEPEGADVEKASRGVAGETLADASADEGGAEASESVVPEGSIGALSTRNILVLGLAILLLASVTFVWLRRRQYKPVSEEFSVRTDTRAVPAMEPAPAPEEGSAPAEETPSEEETLPGEEPSPEEEVRSAGEAVGAEERATEEEEEPREPESGPEAESPDLSETGEEASEEYATAEEPSEEPSEDSPEETREDTGAESIEDFQLDLGSEEEDTSREEPRGPEDQTPPTLDVDLSEFDTGEKKDEGGDETGDETGESEVAGEEEEKEDEFDLGSLSLDEEPGGGETDESEWKTTAEGPGESEEGRIDKPEFEGGEGLTLGEDEDKATDEEVADNADESGVADKPETDAGGAGTESDEVTTKLDLGRAYLDMGEPEMARNLLQEVKEQGNAEQRHEAEELLERAG